jgi:glyoxylase-like metal-dependent hydrolase (beta-lactamase superfamily II)
MTRRFNRFLLAALLLIGVPAYWLLIDNRPGDIAPKPVTIAQLRQAAVQLPGAAPKSVEVEAIGWRELPATLFVAGAGLKSRRVTVMAFRVLTADGREVLIDTGLTRKAAEEMGVDTFSDQGQTRVMAAIKRAGLILITHEHPDHIGGLRSAGPEASKRAMLNPAQLEAPGAARLAPHGLQAVAPGIVVIPAPSHTPGSQMIFVRLVNGREYLFAGDIATYEQSWKELRARSRLIGDFIAPEVRGEVYAWLRTIQALKAENPQLIVVPGHDIEALFSEVRPSGIRRGFSG